MEGGEGGGGEGRQEGKMAEGKEVKEGRREGKKGREEEGRRRQEGQVSLP